MQSFFKLLNGVQVLPLTEKIVRQFGPEWDYAQTGPCTELAMIWLRKAQVLLEPDNRTAYDTTLLRKVPVAKNIALDLMRLIEGTQLGNVFVSVLQPGGKTLLHAHEGDAYFSFYTRYYVVLQGLPGAQMVCGEETVQTATGEAWWFDPMSGHQSVNNSADDFIRLGIDVRAD